MQTTRPTHLYFPKSRFVIVPGGHGPIQSLVEPLCIRALKDKAVCLHPCRLSPSLIVVEVEDCKELRKGREKL